MSGVLKFYNGTEDIIIGGNKASVDVSSTAPENPKLGDLWFDTSDPIVIPSFVDVVNISAPIEGYANNKVVISVEGILEDDLVIADLRTSGLEIAAKEEVVAEYSKVMEMNAITDGIEILVSEIPVIEIPIKLVVIHK